MRYFFFFVLILSGLFLNAGEFRVFTGPEEIRHFRGDDIEYVPKLQAVFNPYRPWRLFAVEKYDLLLCRLTEVTSKTTVACPVKTVRLYRYLDEVYGEAGFFTFRLPESELVRNSELSSRFMEKAFRGLLREIPLTPSLPGRFKCSYSNRFTDQPLRRGLWFETFGEESAVEAAKARANLVCFVPGENVKMELETAKVPVFLDCSAMDILELKELVRELKNVPNLAGILIGGGPWAYNRAVAVREVAPELVLLTEFGELPFPLRDVIYTADPADFDRAAVFQQRYGARFWLVTGERKMIDRAEAMGWEWCAPFPTSQDVMNCFLRQRVE